MPIADLIATDACAEPVNPQWFKLLSLLARNVSDERCGGTDLVTSDDRRIIDFLSGYCVHNTGQIAVLAKALSGGLCR
jgi:acetylornithine/succinyldiaminopimelate/putrescine aminotransferase